MAEKIRLVQGDTRPQLRLSLTDRATGQPINLVGATVRLKFRPVGEAAIKEMLDCALAPGIILRDGSLSVDPPYDQFGSGGRAVCDWTPTALDTAGDFEGEVEITFSDGGVQTVDELLRFAVREEF